MQHFNIYVNFSDFIIITKSKKKSKTHEEKCQLVLKNVIIVGVVIFSVIKNCQIKNPCKKRQLIFMLGLVIRDLVLKNHQNNTFYFLTKNDLYIKQVESYFFLLGTNKLMSWFCYYFNFYFKLQARLNNYQRSSFFLH